MILFLFSLAFVVFSMVFYLAHLAWQIRPSNHKKLTEMERTWGLGMLKEIQGPTKDTIRTMMNRKQKRQYSHDYMSSMMPRIYAEAQQAVRASGNPMTLWHFAVFHVIYKIVEFKLRYAARIEDMHYVIGAEASVMRWAVRSSG